MTTIIPTPAPVPNPLSSDFGTKAYDFTVWMAEAAPAMQSVGEEMNAALNNSLLGVTSSSTTSLLIGTGSKTLTVGTGLGYALGMPLKLASAANVSNYMKGVATAYNIGTGSLTVNVASIGGSGTFADWAVSFDVPDATAPKILTRNITSADTLIASDVGKLVTLAGTFTLSATAAVTLGAGWFCYLMCASGDVTLDPSGLETVDGVTSGLIKGMYLLTCDGTAFSTQRIGAPAHQVTITSGTSWTALLGAKNVKMRLVGGGAGGGCSGSDGSVAGSGGGGGGVEAFISLSPGTAYTCAIGGGGAVGTSAAGSAGGNTTLTVSGVTYTGNGGSGSYWDGGAGGTGSGAGAIAHTGSKGLSYLAAPTASGARGLGGSSFLGSYGRGGNGGGANGQATAGSAGVIILEW